MNTAKTVRHMRLFQMLVQRLCGLQHRHCNATNTQQTWRQEYLGSRSSTVERSPTRTAAAGTFLRFFQTIFENTSLWRLKCLVTLSTYRHYINKCIYICLYIYLSKLFNCITSDEQHVLHQLLPPERPDCGYSLRPRGH